MPPRRNVIPTAGGCSLHEAGHMWDAVRVQRAVGLTARSILGPRCGALLEAPSELALYWFVPPGEERDWAAVNARLLTTGSTLAVPPHRRTEGPGPFWRICPGEGSWLTNAAALQASIEDAMAPRIKAEHFG